ncbi:MAG TPA: rhomboid family intramembrane serine protease [Gallionella sp.]|nr:rhomboid family intramembrane serine protease [Gallionella sp.]
MSAIDIQFPQSFFSSSNSHLSKVRRWMWLGSLIGFAIGVIAAKGSTFVLFTLVIIGMAVLLPMELIYRRQMRPGQPLVMLDDNGIESPILNGKIKKLSWDEILGITIESYQNNNFLKFQLTDTPAHPDKKNFIGQNSAQPMLPLNPFAADEQRNLIAALNRGLERFHLPDNATTATVVDSLAEDRALEKKLKELTPIPWVTYFLVAANVLIWGAAIVQGANIAHTSADKLLLWGGNAASEVQRGEWWRLFTATFLHGGLMHLFMNMLGLVSIGILVERIYGHRLYMLIYVGSGLIGSALSLHFSAQTAVSVGASGAIFGVTGALLVGVYQHRDRLPKTFSRNMITSMSVFIIYSLLQGFSKQGIDNAAHIGGLLGGAMLAFVLPERFNMEHFLANWKKRAALGSALAALMTACLTMTAPSAAIDQRMMIEGQAAFIEAMKDFDVAVKTMQKDQTDVQAGIMTEREADDRSRSVLAPLFRKAQQDFSKATFPETDPRLPLLNDMKRMNNLILESMEMASTYKEGSDKPEPADPQRMAEINAELNIVGARIQQLSQTLKNRH